MARSRLLHTCGASILALGQKAYTRAQHIDGRLGKMANRIDNLLVPTSPYIYAIQHQFLAVLSFADTQILFFESLVETLIPQSAEVFDRIDDLLHVVEMLPRECDDVMNEFALILNQGTVFDWAMAYFVFWLDCLIASLIHWGSNITTEIKTIHVIDTQRSKETEGTEDDENLRNAIKKGGKDDHQLIDSPMSSSSPISCCSEEHTRTASRSSNKGILESPSNLEHESSQDEIKEAAGNEESPMTSPSSGYRNMKCSYKEILEKGGKESNDKRENFVVDDENCGEEGDTITDKKDEEVVREDPILELFESSWHLSPVKRSILQP